ncbi:MAG TPA: NAD(P)H-binding protein [Myxococcota bacterium]
MTTETRIFVTGATGQIGRPLVQQLLARGARVSLLTRRPAEAKALGAVDVVEGDLAHPDSYASSLKGCARAFFLGGGEEALARDGGAFAAAARAAGVAQVVAISSGTVEMKPKVVLGDWHLAMEEAIDKTGIAATFLRPDNFASNALRWAGGIKAKSMVFSTHADGQSVPIDPRDIAAVAACALLEPGHEGKRYVLSGPAVMTAREQVACIGAELGRTLQVVEVPAERARAGMIESGMSAAMANAVLELMGQAPRPTTTVRDVTGVDARTFATWVKDNRAAFA